MCANKIAVDSLLVSGLARSFHFVHTTNYEPFEPVMQHSKRVRGYVYYTSTIVIITIIHNKFCFLVFFC